MKHSGLDNPDRVSMLDLFDEALGKSLDDQSVLDQPGQADETTPRSAGLGSAIQHGYAPVLSLGRGSSATVWRCVDRSIGREFALKMIRSDLGLSGEESTALLQCEAEILSSLNHPGIVHAVRLVGAGADTCLVLDFIDGDELLLYCRACTLSIDQRLRLFGRLIDAVAYLHKKGLVHGDIKPEHVLVREDGTPVLIDFGLAAHHRHAQRIAGTPARVGGSGRYCAPEVLSRTIRTPTPRQDVYALGQVLRDLYPEVSADSEYDTLLALITQATATDPKNRLPDAAAMQTAMQGLLNRRRELVSPDRATPRRLKTNMFAWGTLAATLALLASSAAWIIGGGSEEDADPNRVEYRGSLLPGPMATRLESITASVYRNQPEEARKSLDAYVQDNPAQSSTWEARHLLAQVQGSGSSYPFGDMPYGDLMSVCAAYEPTTRTIAYLRREGNATAVWITTQGQAPRRMGQASASLHTLAISPDGRQVAALAHGHNAMIWTDHPELGIAPTVHTLPLPAKAEAKGMWFSRDGKSLYLHSPKSRTISQWPTDHAEPQQAIQVINNCDFAMPLPSGDSTFLAVAGGERLETGRTLLRLFNEDGQVIRRLELKDDLIPISADTLPSSRALLVLGMPNGYVRIHDSSNGGWQEDCDLGRNSAIPSVLYDPTEQRIFASFNRVHVLDTQGHLLMRLGDRDAPPTFIPKMYFEPSTATLTTHTHRDVRQWNAAPKP